MNNGFPPGPGENLHNGQLGYDEMSVSPFSMSLLSNRVSSPFQTPTQETSFPFSQSVIWGQCFQRKTQTDFGKQHQGSAQSVCGWPQIREPNIYKFEQQGDLLERHATAQRAAGTLELRGNGEDG